MTITVTVEGVTELSISASTQDGTNIAPVTVICLSDHDVSDQIGFPLNSRPLDVKKILTLQKVFPAKIDMKCTKTRADFPHKQQFIKLKCSQVPDLNPAGPAQTLTIPLPGLTLTQVEIAYKKEPQTPVIIKGLEMKLCYEAGQYSHTPTAPSKEVRNPCARKKAKIINGVSGRRTRPEHC